MAPETLPLAGRPLALLIFLLFVTGAAGQQTALQQAGVCSRCHVAQVLEWSASRHTAAGVACQNCHGASAGHVANERNQVRPDTLPQGGAIGPFCSTCHKAGCPKTKRTADCQTCHHVHALSDPNDKRMRPAESPEAATYGEYRRQMERGESHVARGEWRQARGAFEAALKLRPADVRAGARKRMTERRLNPAIPGFAVVGNEFDPVSGLPMQVRVEGLGIEMRLMPGADFDMGTERFANAQPVHTVRIEPYYIATHEVSQQVWTELVEENPSLHKGPALPVHNISWNDAQEFLARLNARVKGGGFRLPTEAEWELAAEGTTADGENSWHRGNTAAPPAAGKFHESNAYSPQPGGTKRPNRRGLYDVTGNVAEWCSSLYAPYPYNAKDGRESAQGAGLRTVRGGGYADSLADLDPAARHSARAGARIPWNGMRLVRNP
ncbi:MAG: SUMF1/EgtB/PvdO family nonheme iron enzyme [Bryobacterales bacterium]|nr:SUMF1/EgtB/PvdO family nonheme iron enzyme [Bryobacterales bacterium]